jgi:hypothetical protein
MRAMSAIASYERALATDRAARLPRAHARDAHVAPRQAHASRERLTCLGRAVAGRAWSRQAGIRLRARDVQEPPSPQRRRQLATDQGSQTR